MKFKAVITDLDGTTIDSPDAKLASARLKAAVQNLEATGFKVCAATGRSETFAQPVLDSMGLRHPAIVSGGTRIIDPVTHEEVWRCGLSSDQLRQVIKTLRATQYGCMWNDYNESDYLNGGWNIADFDEYDNTYFFQVCFVPHDDARRIINTLNKIADVNAAAVIALRLGTLDIHVTNHKATKEHAIYELEKIVGVPKSQMIGVGDGHNDIHLFNAVGHKVAMGNAVPDLKEHADEVIGSVKNDGFAEYLEKLTEESK